MTDYILSIDQGTTSSRAILFNREGLSVHSAQEEFPQYFPNDGWIEHEPTDIWQTVARTFQQVITKMDTDKDVIRAIGITNQRETTLVWDRKTGQPIYRAIVWQDRRTSEYCQKLKDDNLESLISEKTGLLIDPYFSATKICWILDNVDGARQRAENGELAFGTVDSYILWKLTAGKEHRTDATNASRTMLFNIHTQEWDEELLTIFNIPRALLPQVMDSSDNFGVTDKAMMGVEIPILAMAGDQQAALFGQTCFREGMAKSTYGTGCFMIVNTGEVALKSESRLLSTVAYRLNGKVTYALEGSIFIAGATVQWLRDGLKLIDDAGDTEPLARQTPVDHGVYLVPAFTGLGAPYWDPNARGAIFGLTRDTGIKEIVTAGLQSVCYQTKDLQKAMENDGERPIALRVDGGMVRNNWLMQFLADILGATVDRPKITETTALGVAYLAGLKAGVYNSLEELEDMWQRERRFEPQFDKTTRDDLYDGWKNAVRRVQSE
ncbi:glycerol kinase GlpK [Colwellia hornerae]|uniref:Glycerol kinase n=1 Tax=Colwellia hornerae TaxID=89402 RepID=A0A5C6Q5H9_9GAMM|nr:glycerol kinase GlpK [Colwellia hornerae]TWX59467.1 glycerol kinase GlpK [Colwellia hornerae]TWX62837.1 glycerol kinase GlpK [Colwellia hornerae]TWX64062.1 glycerol kinase GlpK [Colwellia hornerae]